MCLWLVKGKKITEASHDISNTTPIVADGFLIPHVAENLLSTVRCQQLLKAIWQRTSLSHSQFKQLYLNLIERYAELVQQFPASESHHHACLGGC